MSMQSCNYHDICILPIGYKFLQIVETFHCLISINIIWTPQIVTTSLCERAAISFLASCVIFCSPNPGIIVAVTSYSGPKFFPSSLAQPHIWLSSIKKVLLFLLFGQPEVLCCFEGTFVLKCLSLGCCGCMPPGDSRSFCRLCSTLLNLWCYMNGPGGQCSLLYNGYLVIFPRLKLPGHDVDHPPPSSTEVKERVQL